MLCSSGTARGAAARPTRAPRPTSRCQVATVRASANTTQPLAARLAAGAAAAGLLFGAAFAPAPALAAADPTAAPAEDKEALVATQRAAIEYKIEQGEIARRAELVGKRQVVEREVAEVEDAIQRKLTEDAARLASAEAKGDIKAAEAIGSEAEAVKQQEERVQAAAARLEAQLDQAAIAEKAQEVSLQQQLEFATAKVRQILGLN